VSRPTTDLIYAITLWQPWAAVIVDGPKDIENRTWQPPAWIIGRRVAIHAGKTYDATGAAWIEDKMRELGEMRVPRLALLEARSAVVGVATITGFVRPDGLDLLRRGPCHRAWHIHDQVGFVLEDRRALAVPVPCRGAQGFWKMDDAVVEQVGGQL